MLQDSHPLLSPTTGILKAFCTASCLTRQQSSAPPESSKAGDRNAWCAAQFCILSFVCFPPVPLFRSAVTSSLGQDGRNNLCLKSHLDLCVKQTLPGTEKGFHTNIFAAASVLEGPSSRLLCVICRHLWCLEQFLRLGGSTISHGLPGWSSRAGTLKYTQPYILIT